MKRKGGWRSVIEEARVKNLSTCPYCGASEGQPCRKPNLGITKPHRDRLALGAAREGARA